MDRQDAIRRTVTWLRQCSDWLLETDLDMECPMEIDPLSLAEELEAMTDAVAQAKVLGFQAGIEAAKNRIKAEASRLRSQGLMEVADRMVAEADHLRALASAAPEPSEVPRINIRCETSDGVVKGSTSLNVVRVEAEDDGSWTAVTDHWPAPTEPVRNVGDDPELCEIQAKELLTMLDKACGGSDKIRAALAAFQQEHQTRPSVRVTPNGLVYVDPKELVQSAEFRQSHQKLKELFFKIFTKKK